MKGKYRNEINGLDKHEPKKGNCIVCGELYDREVWDYGKYDLGKYDFVRCPSCHYHPEIEGKITDLIKRNYSLVVSCFGIELNSEYISKKILENIIKIYWPKKVEKREVIDG